MAMENSVVSTPTDNVELLGWDTPEQPTFPTTGPHWPARHRWQNTHYSQPKASPSLPRKG